jgi:hypothetical protein
MEDIETKRRERSLKFREPFIPMTLGLSKKASSANLSDF